MWKCKDACLWMQRCLHTRAMNFLRGSFGSQIGLRKRRPAARRERYPLTAPKLHRVGSLPWKAKHPKASPSDMGWQLTQPLTHKDQGTCSSLWIQMDPVLPGGQGCADPCWGPRQGSLAAVGALLSESQRLCVRKWPQLSSYQHLELITTKGNLRNI